MKQECGESDQEEVEKAGNFSRIVQIAEAWLVAAPQAVLGLYIIGTGVHPGTGISRDLLLDTTYPESLYRLTHLNYYSIS